MIVLLNNTFIDLLIYLLYYILDIGLVNILILDI